MTLRRSPVSLMGGKPGRRQLTSWPISCWATPQAEGAEPLGPDGLLSQVIKALLKRALAEEMVGHLGYENTTRPGETAVIAATAPLPGRSSRRRARSPYSRGRAVRPEP